MGGLSVSGQRKQKAHFFGEAPERRPWAIKREDRPAAFAGRSESVLLGWDTGLAYTSEYPIPSAKRSVNLRSGQTG